MQGAQVHSAWQVCSSLEGKFCSVSGGLDVVNLTGHIDSRWTIC